MSLSFLAADVSPLLILSAIVVVALVGGLLPASPLEPMLIAVAALGSPVLTVQVVAVAAVTQMVPKTLLFLGSGKAAGALSPRQRRIVDRLAAHLTGHRRAQVLTIFVSAVLGVPPFYLMTLVCGGLRLKLRDYFVAGAVGRALRYTGLALLPRLIA